MNGPRRLAGRAALLLLAVATTACGYSSRRLAAVEGVRTVAVLQFENDTYRRDLEFRLTRAVAEEVRARTSFRIASPQTADALLSGTIRAADTRLLLESTDFQPILQRFRWVVDAKLVDRRTGRTLREWRAIDRAEWTEGRFGESLDSTATDDLARILAEEVVEGLERPVGSTESVPPIHVPPARKP